MNKFEHEEIKNSLTNTASIRVQNIISSISIKMNSITNASNESEFLKKSKKNILKPTRHNSLNFSSRAIYVRSGNSQILKIVARPCKEYDDQMNFIDKTGLNVVNSNKIDYNEVFKSRMKHYNTFNNDQNNNRSISKTLINFSSHCYGTKSLNLNPIKGIGHHNLFESPNKNDQKEKKRKNSTGRVSPGVADYFDDIMTSSMDFDEPTEVFEKNNILSRKSSIFFKSGVENSVKRKKGLNLIVSKIDSNFKFFENFENFEHLEEEKLENKKKNIIEELKEEDMLLSSKMVQNNYFKIKIFSNFLSFY